MNSISQHISRIRHNELNTNVIYYINDKMSDTAEAKYKYDKRSDVTPWLTDSTREVENLSDKIEKLFSSSLFLDLCNTYLELSAVMPVQCCLNRIEP